MHLSQLHNISFRLAISGAAILGGITLLMHLVGLVVIRDKTELAWIFFALHVLLFSPTYWLLHICGMEWPAQSFHNTPLSLVGAMVAVNTAIGAVCGITFRFCWQWVQSIFIRIRLE